jgi:hypothetical protein
MGMPNEADIAEVDSPSRYPVEKSEALSMSLDWAPQRERRMSFELFSFPFEFDSARPSLMDMPDLLPMDNAHLMTPKSKGSSRPTITPKVEPNNKTARVSMLIQINEELKKPVTRNFAIEDIDKMDEDGERRIGIYTIKERRVRINKFHLKRKSRVWKKRIKYDCRKKLADDRPRVKGRFVKRLKGADGTEEDDLSFALRLNRLRGINKLHEAQPFCVEQPFCVKQSFCVNQPFCVGSSISEGSSTDPEDHDLELKIPFETGSRQALHAR